MIATRQITVPALQVAYLAAPDFAFGFSGNVAAALMTAAPAECWLSLDGVNDHVHLVAGSPAGSFATQRDYAGVWLRGAGVPVTVQVIAETDEE